MNDQELVDAFPGARIDQDSRAWFQGLRVHRLLVNRCGDCARWSTPPASICPDCWSSAVTPTQVSGRGVVHSVAGSGARALAVIELDEQDGLRLTSTVIGGAPIGTAVEVVWDDPGPYPAFRPVECRPVARGGP